MIFSNTILQGRTIFVETFRRCWVPTQLWIKCRDVKETQLEKGDYHLETRAYKADGKQIRAPQTGW